MLDPVSALSLAASAVSNMKTLINAGQDTTKAISQFGSAWADLNEAERRAKNPPWYKLGGTDLERAAAEAFACKKRAQALKKELESLIRYVHGPTGLQEYKDILRDMRKSKERTEWKRQKRKQAIIEWIVGILAVIAGLAIMGTILYFVGKNEGKW